MAALGTDAVGQDHLLAIGARYQIGRGHLVMVRSAHIALGTGRSSLWDRHLFAPYGRQLLWPTLYARSRAESTRTDVRAARPAKNKDA